MRNHSRGEAEETRDPTEALDALEKGIEALRLAYEKYFAGVDRTAPAKQRQRLERELRILETRQPRSTVLRFRLGGLRARFVTYKHYWTRVEHEIERGTSRRDLLRRGPGRGAPLKPDAAPAETAEGEGEGEGEGEAEAATAPADPVARKSPRRPAPTESPGLDAGNLRAVFKDLVQAKRAAGESIKGLTYAALVRKLTREAPKLLEKHGCEHIRFEVSVSSGKVRLRSRPSSRASHKP